MAYQRTLYVKTQLVIGTWDEDGNLVEKSDRPELKELCFPYGLSLERYIQEVEREALPDRERVKR